SADSASTPARSSRPHMGHENLCRVIELDVLDHRVLDPQHGAPYAGVLHAVLRSVVFDLRQATNLDGERRVAVEAHSASHRYGTRATNDDDVGKHHAGLRRIAEQEARRISDQIDRVNTGLGAVEFNRGTQLTLWATPR